MISVALCSLGPLSPAPESILSLKGFFPGLALECTFTIYPASRVLVWTPASSHTRMARAASWLCALLPPRDLTGHLPWDCSKLIARLSFLSWALLQSKMPSILVCSPRRTELPSTVRSFSLHSSHSASCVSWKTEVPFAPQGLCIGLAFTQTHLCFTPSFIQLLAQMLLL